ncbi:MAG: DUF1080 domain-containing protein [Chitinophagaceae bacterium]|nr:DUF1080 domain-containing protein [Chitinophagaceae bacterium]
MKTIILSLALLPMIMSCGQNNQEVTEIESDQAEQEWINMLEGNSLKKWHRFNQPDSIGSAWSVNEQGELFLDASHKKDWQTNNGGDIVYDETFENFHLKLEWKIDSGGNSGIMFYVQEDTSFQYPWQTGPEMQVLDNAAHPDAKIIKHRAGDLYDLISCSKETVKPAGEWNLAEIMSKDGKLDFFLNGENVVSTTMWDTAWNSMIAGSKFKSMKGFGTFSSGKIALQDHGDNVRFRNVLIRKL